MLRSRKDFAKGLLERSEAPLWSGCSGGRQARMDSDGLEDEEIYRWNEDPLVYSRLKNTHP